MKKNKIIVFILIFFCTSIFYLYSKFYKKKLEVVQETDISEEATYNSNIIKGVNYSSRDSDGNEYQITAVQGEIDYSNSSVLFLTGVKAFIKIKGSENIKISSNYGKYNTDNYDTIFSKNVIINYLDNKILGEYLDFSLQRNSMIISKDVTYTNLENILKADVIEINLKTKDTKIFMYENEKKINIKSKNWNGNY